MSNSMSVDTNDTPGKTYFQPPPGGDVLIRSSDGVEFHAHSVILSIASTVFRDMLTVGTAGSNNAVELTEDAQTISLMFGFIYPVDRVPQIPDAKVLRSCLEVARKYDLNAMLGDIDSQIGHRDCALLPSALEFYRLGLDYDLPNTRASAARKLLGGQFDLLDPAHLANFIKDFGLNATSAALLGVQGARFKIITEVILDFSAPHMRELCDDEYSDISCGNCRSNGSVDDEGHFHIPPGWALQWSKATHEALAAAPLSECLRYFNASIFDTSSFHGGPFAGCSDCLDGIWSATSNRELFNEWASEVKFILEGRLEALEPLYKLC